MNGAQRVTRQVVQERGWRTGSTLENKVSLLLSRFHFTADSVSQQFRIARYRVDYAWPDIGVVLEADGWYHRSPEGAARDAERDSWLRARGWLVFRVDDRHGDDELAEQVAQVARIVRMLLSDGWPWKPRR